ncbi:hypothetical protein EV356DRAFT_580816 [Viridothelium virens]|uniref:Uncharacterized protein n=1 Tax=Viridothelium virens TaxID=1048519 RepID=A0A6A6GUH9_VIRVR|nr:hypothetical protein EV356DRAFT_580816 [Viridothelium virens]
MRGTMSANIIQKTQNPQKNPQGSPQTNLPKKPKKNTQSNQKMDNLKKPKKPKASNGDTWMGEENSVREKRKRDGRTVQSIENATQGLRWSGGARPNPATSSNDNENGRSKESSSKVSGGNIGGNNSGNANNDGNDNDNNDNNNDDEIANHNDVDNHNDDGIGNDDNRDDDNGDDDGDDNDDDDSDDDDGAPITIQNFRTLEERPGHVFDLGKWKKIIAVRGIGARGNGFGGHQLCLLHNIKKNGKKHNLVELVPLSKFGKHFQYKTLPDFKKLMLYPRDLQDKQLQLKDIKIGAVFYSRRDDDIRKGKPNTFWWFTADKLKGEPHFATNTTFKQCFGVGRIEAEEIRQLKLTGRHVPAYSAKLWTSIEGPEDPEQTRSADNKAVNNKANRKKTSTAKVNIQSNTSSAKSTSAARPSSGKGKAPYATPPRSVTPDEVVKAVLQYFSPRSDTEEEIESGDE